jgi:hypothetical protein
MFDAFLLLTPILMLAIVALQGFGCGRIGFDPPPAPKGLTATTKCGWVELHWDALADSPNYELFRITGGYEQLIYEGSATSYNDTWVLETPAWTAPSYKVRAKYPPHLLSEYSAPVTPTRMPQAFLTMPATQLLPQTNYTGFVGMEIRTSKVLTICALGRFVFGGSGTNPNKEYCEHPMLIVDAVRDTVVGAAVVVTVPGANFFNALVDPNGSSFVYAQLIPEVQIFADSINTQGAFYIVSGEKDMTGMTNPDAWCANNTPVIPTPDAVIVGAVTGNLGGWVRAQTGNYSYGPVNFLYNVSEIIQ